MKKRMLAMLLVLMLLIGILPTGVFATEATNKGYLDDLRLVHADTGDAYLTGFNPETYEYSFVVPSDVSNSKMSIGALLSGAAPEGSTITMKYKNYYNLTGNTKSVVLTSSATENTKGSKFSSFVSTSTGNSCTIEVGVEGNIQIYTINVYRYEGIKLNKTEMTIPVGSTPSLTASKGFGLGDADAVTWSTSDETVATVDNGVITAKGVGTATITAAAKTYTAACTVTVKAVDELLVGRNTFGYLEDLVISQADRYTDVAIDFDFDPTQLWQEFEVNSNGPRIHLAVTADEKYADNYGSIVVNFEYSVDGGATWVNDSGSKYDKNILNDGTLSRMFQNVTVGDGMDMSFHAGETLLMRMIVGTYTPVTSATGATAENSDVYYFTVTQRAALGGIAVANGEGTAFALDQEFGASDTKYIIKNFSGDTVNITPTIGRAAKDCKIYVEGKEVASGAAAALTVSALPVNEYGYHYATIDVKYEGTGVASGDTYTVTLAPGDYTPTITTQPAAATNCTQGDDVSLNIVAAAPENKGELTYSWKYSTRSNMYSAVDLGTSTVNSVKVPTETSGTVYLQCTVTNTYNGVTYTVASEVVSVTIEAKSAAAPVININRSDLTGGGTYYMNETAEFPLYTIADAADNGTITYEWFRSDRADYTNTDGSEPESVGAGKIQWVGTSAIGNVQCLYPVMDKVGTWYYFCKVTNTITLPDGTTTSTSTNTAISNAYTVVELGIDLAGSGTEADPYQITSAADMDHIAERVNMGISFNGMYLKVMNDITLSDTWAGIGALKEGAATAKGSTVNGFAGTLFGANEDIIITIPAGCPGLLNYSNASTVKNLSIYGENITGSAIVNKSYVNYGTDDDYNMGINPINITIENVTLKSGSHTTGAGLARGGGSGANTTNVINCVVESGVTIGSESANSVGSFVAVLNGSIINCTSAATVYGVNHVGGLAGHKGETMGACTISNSSFTGKVVATGNWVGGLMGRGYSDAVDGGLNDYTTAPNTPVVTIANSYVSGSVSGADYVGGLFGGEPVVQECWANGAGSVRNNVFYGTIIATGENVGAIVGYMNSMNANQSGMNNYYLDTCGASKGFGKINIAPADFDPTPLATAKTAVEMANGTVTALLNESETSYKNWVQGVHHPVLSADPVAYYLQVSGNYKTKYTVGEELDLTGIELRAVWSDGSVTYPTLDDVKVESYDKTTRGQQTVTLTYGAVSIQIPITVLLPEGQIEVSFTLLGDSKHDSDTDGNVHTLAKENLTTWIAEKKYTVSNNATVLDLVDMVLVANNMTYTNSNGNYIDSITYNGEKLAEFDNGGNSGWMFTLNGVHGLLGVSEQYLNDGDVIVFHYTDDYTKEGYENSGEDSGELDPDADADHEKVYKDTGDYISALGTPNVGSIGGEWMVIGLTRSSREVPAGYYDNVVKYVKENIDENERLHKSKSTDNSRIILALTAMGCDVTNVDGHNLLKGLDEMSYIQKQGINGPIWALIALDSHGYEPVGDVTREKLINVILAAQLADGGWALSGNAADADMTGMALQALAPYYETDARVKAAVDKALVKLSAMQNADGTYSTGGAATSESIAQVIVALIALGISPETDSRFIKNGISVLDALCAYAVEDGGFKHVASGDLDGMATEQGYYALAAYYRFQNGKTSLYDMSDVTIKTSNPDAPENPTNPSNPSDPTNPSNPSDPTNPSNPVDPSKPGDSTTPQTGDNTNIALYGTMMVLSVAALTVLLIAEKKRKYVK